MLASLVFPLASPGRQIPAKAKSGRHSSSANQWVTFGWLSVHSQNEVAGTRQRHSALSHPRQIGRLQIAHVRDWRVAEIRRRRESPAHHGQLAFAIARNPNNRCHRVRVDGWQGRKVIGQVARDLKEATDGLLIAGDAVEVANWGRKSLPGKRLIVAEARKLCAT